MENLNSQRSSEPQPRQPRCLNPTLLTTTASNPLPRGLTGLDSTTTSTSKFLKRVEIGPAEPIWENISDFIEKQGLRGDFLFPYQFIKDRNITDIETEGNLKSMSREAGPYIYPVPISYATPHAKKDKLITGKENAHTIGDFLHASKESKNVKIGFFNTGNGSTAHRSDKEIAKWQWHCWVAVLIDNPGNKPGKHMLIFDCDSYNETGNGSSEPLFQSRPDVLTGYRPKEWLYGPMNSLLDQCRTRSAQGKRRVLLEDVWLGDCVEKGSGVCVLTAFRFIEDFVREWGDAVWNPDHALLAKFRKFDMW